MGPVSGACAKLDPQPQRASERLHTRVFVWKAVLQLLVEQLDPDLLQSGTRCQHLSNNVGTVPLALYHPLQAADLSLDPLQSVQYLFVGSSELVFDFGPPCDSGDT